MPKGRGRKFATTCIRSDPEIKAVSSKMRECLKIYAGVSPGTKWLVRDHSLEWEQWDYCRAHCGFRVGLLYGRLQRWPQKKLLTKPIQSGVGRGGMGYLQITNIDVLQGADCLTMCKKSTLVPHTQVLVRGINSTKVMDLDKQVDLDSNSFSEKYSVTFTLIVSILPLLLLQCLFSSCVPVLPFSL